MPALACNVFSFEAKASNGARLASRGNELRQLMPEPFHFPRLHTTKMPTHHYARSLDV
ncbi:hypothetical protein ACWGI9_11410 [Streptomyces sp. NPDC054833]